MSLHDLSAKLLDGTPKDLRDYAGRVLLVVNTASECGCTPQYAGLQQLYETYKDRGFDVLAFPSNDFGEQEPGSAEQIAKFCSTNYKVTFPLFEKVATRGPDQSPVYRFLSADYGEPKWNFHKYLVDRNGKAIASYVSDVEPESRELVARIESLLGR